MLSCFFCLALTLVTVVILQHTYISSFLCSLNTTGMKNSRHTHQKYDKTQARFKTDFVEVFCSDA